MLNSVTEKLLSSFGIWVCEATFSIVNLMKPKYRSCISVKVLKNKPNKPIKYRGTS